LSHSPWAHTNTAATAAPTIPATPYWILVAIATFGVLEVEDAFVAVDADEAVAGLFADDDPPFEDGVVAEGTEAAEDPLLGTVLGVVELVDPFKQVESPPACTVNMADCEDNPDESRRLRLS